VSPTAVVAEQVSEGAELREDELSDDYKTFARHHLRHAIARALESDFVRTAFKVVLIGGLFIGGLKLFLLADPGDQDQARLDQLAAAQSTIADASQPAVAALRPTGDPPSTKAVQDRLANAGKEQLVTKQEEPVALKDLGTASAPRVVLPAPVAPAPPAPPPAAAAPPPAAPLVAPRAGAIDAKPIRVERITGTTDPSGRPISVPPAPKGAPAPSGGGPLSLQPQSEAAAPPAAPAPRTRAAAVVPSETTTATAGHVVQLSSQKSESEAQSVFRSLQAKFPNELGDRQPIIRRADLGTRGVVYRTQVGPFSSSAEANKFCASYKAAGGQCFVP